MRGYAAVSSRAGRVLIIVGMVVALGGVTAQSASAYRVSVERGAGSYASAETGDCQEVDGTTTCLLQFIEVAKEGKTTQVCVYFATTIHPPVGEPTAIIESGCTTRSHVALALDPRLTTATLQETSLATVVEVCDEQGACTTTEDSATVSGAWTGIGTVDQFRDHYITETGQCRTIFVGVGQRREALATLTIDGATVGAGFGMLVRARSLVVSTPACSR
jgi:hypothetical protein